MAVVFRCLASHWDLSGSPEAHQNFEGSTPELCSGVHQKGCDLEGVEGATPPTPNHSFKTMTTYNTDYSNTELLDQELTTAELTQVSGGLQPFQPFQVSPITPEIEAIIRDLNMDNSPATICM